MVLQVIRLAMLYFGAVFAAGFALGMLRVTFLVPLVGQRYAELMEIPVMLIVIYMTASAVAKRVASSQQALTVGLLAVVLLLVAEILLAALLLGKSPVEALLDKDAVSGTAYYLSLVVFAVMPWWLLSTRPRPIRD